MKKLSIFIIAFLLIFCVSCAEGEKELGGQTLADGIINENIEMSQDDMSVVIGFFNCGKWEKDIGNCISDVNIQIIGRTLTYHSECGTFNDAKNGEHFKLTDAQREVVNATLSKYVTIVEPEQNRSVVDIIDTTKDLFLDFPAVEEVFYNDRLYDYIFGCPKSAYIVVKFSDGTSLPLVEALERGAVLPDHLDKYGIPYHKEKVGVETEA